MTAEQNIISRLDDRATKMAAISNIAGARDCREAENTMKFSLMALKSVLHWAQSRCPCHNEEPNPCTLCGASVENLEACKAVEGTIPRQILSDIRASIRMMEDCSMTHLPPSTEETSILGKSGMPETARITTGDRFLTNAELDVAKERTRQVIEEGWTAEHDDKHEYGELAMAAAAYASNASSLGKQGNITVSRGRNSMNGGWFSLPRLLWPFEIGWWKPTDRRRDLVKAAALIIAEIERLDRRFPHPGMEG